MLSRSVILSVYGADTIAIDLSLSIQLCALSLLKKRFKTEINCFCTRTLDTSSPFTVLKSWALRQKFATPGISELSVQNIRDSGEMLSKDRYKTTSGFFVIPLLSQLWEQKNYCERRNELSSWRPVQVALPNPHIHLCLFKLGCDVLALLSSVMYILSGKNITAVYPMSRRRWDQNTTQLDNRLNRARATYVRLLHISSMMSTIIC
jgi:hypothetical protein